MSQNNGQRARFQINRKRRVLHLMKTRELKAALTGSATTEVSAAKPAGRAGPARGAK